LHRLVGLFAARGYNIESLTVAETDRKAHTSRVTIVTRGTQHVLAQIEAQLTKMVSTRHVQDVTRDPNGLERELALIKVKGSGPERVEALRRAFDETLRDPEFIREAALERSDISPMTGEQLASLIKDLIEAPDEIKAKVRVAIQPRNTDLQEVAGGAKAGGE
jgi:acetolactate synthase small subunit